MLSFSRVDNSHSMGHPWPWLSITSTGLVWLQCSRLGPATLVGAVNADGALPEPDKCLHLIFGSLAKANSSSESGGNCSSWFLSRSTSTSTHLPLLDYVRHAFARRGVSCGRLYVVDVLSSDDVALPHDRRRPRCGDSVQFLFFANNTQ